MNIPQELFEKWLREVGSEMDGPAEFHESYKLGWVMACTAMLVEFDKWRKTFNG